MNYRLQPGDLVEVRNAAEILSSLDSKGTLEGLPFMPEMLGFCGRRYRVFQRVVQMAIDDVTQPLRGFKKDDVVLLDGLRCSGLDHDGCQRGCMIFWREAWLEKVKDARIQSSPLLAGKDKLRARLETSAGPGVFFCQSSQLQKVSDRLSHLQRIKNCFGAVRVGNCSVFGMAKRLAVWAWWKGRQKLMGPHPRGKQKPTPVESLNLQPGDLVEVKTLAEITKTLDKNGKNRGLHFSADMRLFCGKQFRVSSRADRLIAEMTGQMGGFSHTVILEGLTCDSNYYAFGGCPRMDFLYWREIWLKRVDAKSA